MSYSQQTGRFGRTLRVLLVAGWGLGGGVGGLSGVPLAGEATALIAALQSDDVAVRWEAQQRLVKQGEVLVEPVLQALREACLQEGSSAVQARLVKALEALGSLAGEAVHNSYLLSQHPAKRRGLLTALCAVADWRAVPALRAALQEEEIWTESPSLFQRLAQTLADLHDEEAVPLLRSHLQHSSPEVRTSAAQALGQLGSLSALAALHDALRDSDPSVRQAAAMALGRMGIQAASTELAAVLERDPAVEVRRAVAWALGRLSDRQMVASLLKAAQQPALMAVALQALGDLGAPEAVEMAQAALQSPEEAVRAAAAYTLGRLQVEAAAEPLTVLLTQDTPRVRARAAEALLRLNAPATLLPTLEYLQTVAAQLSPEQPLAVRLEAVRTLGQFPLPQAGAVLQPLLHDPHPDLRRAAAEALGQMGIEAAIAPLLEALADLYGPVRRAAGKALVAIAQSPALRLAVVEALKQWLGQNSGRGFFEALHALLELQVTTDPVPTLRQHAQQCLLPLEVRTGSVVEARPEYHCEIDWGRAAVRANGLGIPPPGVTPPRSRMLAQRIAVADAIRNLTALLYGIQREEQAWLPPHRILRQEATAGGAWEVTIEVSLLALPLKVLQRFCEPMRGAPLVIREGIAPTSPPSKENPPTGVVIDTRGMGVRGSLGPQIVDLQGRSIWRTDQIYGLYHANLDSAIGPYSRAGEHPWIIRAVGRRGKTGAVVRLEEAELLRRDPHLQRLLRTQRVVFLLEEITAEEVLLE